MANDRANDEHLGHEARAQGDDHLDVKVWLRLLACSTEIEQYIRQRLRARSLQPRVR